MAKLDLQQRQLCDIQGRLFLLSLQEGYESQRFVAEFMNSRVAAALDDVYDRMQWAGEEYMLEELADEVGGLPKGELLDREILYWMGYVYRYWHYYTGATSKEIYRMADVERMKESWLGFHTMDVEMAIDDLIELYRILQEKE